MKVVSFLVAVALVGCGSANFGGKGDSKDDDEDPVAPADPAAASHHSMLVQSAAALPACDATAEGWLVYLSAEAKFQACTAGAWADVAIKGEKGDKGDAGAPGAGGLQVVARYSCDGSEDLDPDPDVDNSGMRASIDVFTSGWFNVTCMDWHVNYTYTDGDTSADTWMWPPNSKTPSCVPFYVSGSFDVATESFTWKANSSGLTEKVACTKSP